MSGVKLDAPELITASCGVTVGDFWAWAYSDVLSNRNRSIFAEFLVGVALGVTDTPRVEWDSVDLRYRDRSIEVKSSAYLQAWPNTGLSIIRFDIARKRPWDAASNTYAEVPRRSADIFVFCLLAEKELDRVDVLNAASWEFYPLACGTVEELFGSQKSLSLGKLKSLCAPVSYAQLKGSIDRLIDGSTPRL